MPITDTDIPVSLAAALADLQTQLPHVGRGKTAKVVTKEKGTYTYTYADLAAVSRELLPIMGKLGLAFTAQPTITETGFVLRYTLMHVSGEGISGDYPLPASGSPQQIGSAITYARRYCLCALSGLATDDDDDDGAEAEKAPKPRGRQSMTAAQRREHDELRDGTARGKVDGAQRGPGVPPGEDLWAGMPAGEFDASKVAPKNTSQPGSADGKQVDTIRIQFATLGITGRDERLNRIEQILKAPLRGPHKAPDGSERTSKNLSRDEADEVKRELAEAIKAKRLAERHAGTTP